MFFQDASLDATSEYFHGYQIVKLLELPFPYILQDAYTEDIQEAHRCDFLLLVIHLKLHRQQVCRLYQS